MFACIHAPGAGALAQSFSPWVETVAADTAVFSIAGLGSLYGSPRQIAESIYWQTPHAQVGVASTAEAAILAARNFPGLTFIDPGHEAQTLGVLPITCLPPDPGIFETLALWGIRSLAGFAALPETGVVERLGARGLYLWKLAHGAIERPIQPLIPAATYEEFADLDYPLELAEPLLFLLNRFLHNLCGRLDAQSLSAGALILTLNQTERILHLAFPTRDVKFLLKLLQHDLDAHPPNQPVTRVHLRLLPTEPRRVQHGLFIPAAPEPEKLELTLGKIRGLVGAANVGRPKLSNTHRPGVGFVSYFSNGTPLGFRYFRPPISTRVEILEGVPKRLWSRAVQGEIIQASGPWRSSGDWWRPDAWDRDEWDLALSDGALYRLYYDLYLRIWFLEGTYD
jgi:protein ImuB